MDVHVVECIIFILSKCLILDYICIASKFVYMR